MAPVNFGPSQGSSPLARGLPGQAGNGGVGQRIIPARAGFTPRPPHHSLLIRDHPRSRGVYALGMSWRELGHGSSPLARGLRERGPSGLIGGGIIPARAGFTRVKHLRDFSSGDHPRSRGVYSQSTTPCFCTKGSSPLARGLRGDRVAHGLHVGIIPARAGFTRPVLR